MLVFDATITEHYSKALITKLFFHQILSLIDNPSTPFNDFMTAVAFYFGINTGSAEAMKSTVQSILNNFFAFRICRMSPLTMILGYLLRYRIPIITLRISLTVPFVLSFSLTTLIVALWYKCYLLKFHSVHPSHLEIPPILSLRSSRVPSIRL